MEINVYSDYEYAYVGDCNKMCEYEYNDLNVYVIASIRNSEEVPTYLPIYLSTFLLSYLPTYLLIYNQSTYAPMIACVLS